MRREILARSAARGEDLDALLAAFTVDDALALGGVTRKLFSWSMAERLLERGLRSTEEHRSRTNLYLASMVIDIVEILGATGTRTRDRAAVAPAPAYARWRSRRCRRRRQHRP